MGTKTTKPQPHRLTNKQRAFVEHYIANGFNGTQAAIRAGYSKHTAAQMAYETLRKPYIADLIESRMAELTMTANRVLYLLTQEAEATAEDFIVFRKQSPKVLHDGTEVPVEPLAEFSLWKAHKRGKLHNIKKIKQTKRTYTLGEDGPEVVEITTDFDLVDAHAARVVLGKHHKVLSDRVEVEHILPPELIELCRQFNVRPGDVFEKMINLMGKARMNAGNEEGAGTPTTPALAASTTVGSGARDDD